MNGAQKTYSSSYEERLHTATGGISAGDRADQYLIGTLIKRLEHSVVFSAGSSTALFHGRLVKLNRGDYSRTAFQKNGEWFIPAVFVTETFGLFHETDCHDAVSLSSVAGQLPGYRILSDTGLELCILQSPGVDFSGPADRVLLERLKRFFAEPLLPEPGLNTEQTRVIISEVPYPDGIENWKTNAYTTCYSPAILCRTEPSGKAIYVSHEFSTVMNWKELDTVTVLKKSTDDGKTWREVARIPHVRCACLFEHRGDIYLSGIDGVQKAILITRFHEDMRFEQGYIRGWGGTTPNAVLHANGRIYQALWFSAISAPDEADLLDQDSWTLSESLKPILSKEWFLKESGEPDAPRYTVMEGNMVEGPDGHIYNLMRIESQPAAGYAAILELSPDGTQYLPVLSCRNLLRFPSSVSKFVIRRDGVTGIYLSLTSVKTIPHFGDQRNILSLVWSDDLFHWQTAEILLSDREMMNPVCSAYAHSFQYADFAIDGEDLIMVVREAAGRTNIWHDGNYITFYRVRNFRRYIGAQKG